MWIVGFGRMYTVEATLSGIQRATGMQDTLPDDWPYRDLRHEHGDPPGS